MSLPFLFMLYRYYYSDDCILNSDASANAESAELASVMAMCAAQGEVHSCTLRMKGRSPLRQVGERVNARYKGDGNFYAGKIEAVNSDGTFVVHYDDGDKDGEVAESDLMSDGIGLHIIAIDTIATPEVPKVTVIFVEGFAEGSPAEAAKKEGNICIGDVLMEVNDTKLNDQETWTTYVNGQWTLDIWDEDTPGEAAVDVYQLKFIRNEALLSIYRQCVKEEADQSQDASASIELANVMAPTVSATAGSMTAVTTAVPPGAAPGSVMTVPLQAQVVQAQVVQCAQQAQLGQAHVAQAQVVEVKQQRRC
jgi:hypothetical protein